MPFQIRKMTMEKEHAIAASCEFFSTGCNGHHIAIKPNESAIRSTCLKNFFSMPTVSHRTIKIGSAILTNKPKQHLF